MKKSKFLKMHLVFLALIVFTGLSSTRSEAGCPCPITNSQMKDRLNKEFYKDQFLPAMGKHAEQLTKASDNAAMQGVRTIDALATQMGLQNAANQAFENHRELSGAEKQACDVASVGAGGESMTENAEEEVAGGGDPVEASGETTTSTSPDVVTDIMAAVEGSSGAEDGAYGAAADILERTADLKACKTKGNNGQTEKICPAGDNEVKRGIELFSTGKNVALDDEQAKLATDLVRLITAGHLDPLTITTSDISKLDKPALRLLAEGEILAAKASIASFPFRMEQSLRKEQSPGDIVVMPTGSGGGSLKLSNTGGGVVTASAADKVKFKDFYRGPSYISRLIDINTKKDVEIAYNTAQNITMTYEVREQLKTTNMLLGAILAELMNPRIEKNQAERVAYNARVQKTTP